MSAPLFPGQQHQRCAAQQQNRAPQNHIALVAGLDAGIFGLSGLLGLIVRVLRAAGGALAVLIVKKNLLVGYLNRNGQVKIPRGQDTIQVGDTVIIVTSQKGLRDITDILEK